MTKLMIYGATGYTGRLTCQNASKLGLEFVVGGRVRSKVQQLASSLNVDYRIFNLDDPKKLDSAFQSIEVLLNCAGPFMQTAEPLIEACIRNGVHYLDVSAELDSYHLAEKHSAKANQADAMLLPGCGGSVTMLGCLVGHVLQGIDSASSIDLALHVAGPMSRGSAISAAENLSTKCMQRLNADLVPHDVACTKEFDFDDGKGEVSCFPVTLPDLVTIWKATSVPNIRTYVHVSGDAFPTGDLHTLPDGPTDEQREANPYHAAVVVTAANGATRRAVLHAVNGYSFTALASVEAAKRVLAGTSQSGFQTPVDIFGTGFVDSVPGSSVVTW